MYRENVFAYPLFNLKVMCCFIDEIGERLLCDTTIFVCQLVDLVAFVIFAGRQVFFIGMFSDSHTHSSLPDLQKLPPPHHCVFIFSPT